MSELAGSAPIQPAAPVVTRAVARCMPDGAAALETCGRPEFKPHQHIGRAAAAPANGAAFSPTDLQPKNLTEWRTLRHQLTQRRATRALQRRLRHDPAAYLANAERLPHPETFARPSFLDTPQFFLDACESALTDCRSTRLLRTRCHAAVGGGLACSVPLLEHEYAESQAGGLSALARWAVHQESSRRSDPEPGSADRVGHAEHAPSAAAGDAEPSGLVLRDQQRSTRCTTRSGPRCRRRRPARSPMCWMACGRAPRRPWALSPLCCCSSAVPVSFPIWPPCSTTRITSKAATWSWSALWRWACSS